VRALKNNYIIILVTSKDKLEAEKITQSLLKEHLVACGNIVSPVISFFHWSDKIDRAEECLIIMKSRLDLFSQVAERVKSLHSYEVPEILALPIVDASKAYLDWMGGVLKQS
jgi:periplasmic divalent cation tolerance protein